MEALRYGVIGTGGMGQGHIKVLLHIDGVEIATLADPHGPSMEAAQDMLPETVPAYSDYGEMLQKESLDAVVVATPDFTHADIVCDALGAGLHVLGEKPMASTIEDCNRIVEAASRSGTVYQVGLEMRYLPAVEGVMRIIEEGKIGRVRQMWCKEFRGTWMRKVGDWITQQDKTGGALVEKDCHHFDIFNWVAACEPVAVAAFGSRDLVYGKGHFSIEPTVMDNAQTVTQYEDGTVATLMLNMYCEGYREGLEMGFIGTEGWLVLNWNEGGLDVVWTKRGSGEQTSPLFRVPTEIHKLSHGGGVYYEHVAFARNIRENTAPLTDALAGWWSTVVPLAAERAAAERRVVRIEEYGRPPA